MVGVGVAIVLMGMAIPLLQTGEEQTQVMAAAQYLAGRVMQARTRAVIHRNLTVSLLYNVLGAGLAMAGLITPLLAAILMPISSLSVITMSFRSRTFGGGP